MDRNESEKVSFNRREFEAFLSEIQELVERHRKLLDKVGELTQRQKELEERIRMFERDDSASAEQGSKALSDATSTMKRLMQEADRLLAE